MTNREKLELAIEAAIEAGKKTLNFYHTDMDVVVKDDNSPLTQADLESNRVILSYLEGSNLPVLSEETRVVNFEERSTWNEFWMIDPLDGTKEFINRRSEYTINIALIRAGIPVLGVVYAPVLDTLYYASEETGSFKKVLTPEDTAHTILESSVKLNPRTISGGLNIVASRSHLSEETKAFITELEKYYTIEETKSYGSSLKLCMVAEGAADVYPRLGPTMEWDTAASQAVAVYAGSEVLELQTGKPLSYNKENLLNPYFIVYNSELENVVRKIIA
ncbi:MAG: 3'(2'),5'-bisphosphate nucleotidase CysQ [Bacteroidales bacterium]|nr:3'(2'),5'-bisphosphate nucleotidase CysQ [Bacteroidales bacterium]